MRDRIELIVCHLDVDLGEYYGAVVYVSGLFDHSDLHELSLDRRESGRILSVI